jgi:BCCT family betaine/carnitine transporter
LIAANVEEARPHGARGDLVSLGAAPLGDLRGGGAGAGAVFSYNKGLPLSIRSAFYPILGERVWGWWGHVIDTLAVFATLFGLATSLGRRAAGQCRPRAVYGVPNTITVQVILIIGITAVALISVLRGLDGGVKVLSEINMVMALLLLLFVLFTAGAVAS